MEGIIILLNTLVYMIPLFKFLPCKLQKKEYLFLFFIGFVNIGFVIVRLGNFAVLLLLFMEGAYLLRIQKDTDARQKLCILLISYLFCVVWDNSFAFLFNLSGVDLFGWLKSDAAYVAYMAVYLSFLYLVTSFAAKPFKSVLAKVDAQSIPVSFWNAIMLNTVICFVIFYCNITIGEYIGYSRKVISFNCMLFLGYFICFCLLTYQIVNAYRKSADVKIKEESYEILQKYTSEIENMYSDMRSFKHDYLNIMTSVSGYLEEENFQGLKEYFQQEILPLSEQCAYSNYKIAPLMNIKIPAVKSIVTSKLMYAHEIGCNISVEIAEPVDKIHMNTVDLSRVLGIYLDNAIEGARECPDPEIHFAIVTTEQLLTFVIDNNFIDHKIPYDSINKISVSSKGKNRGIGLFNSQKILDRYDNILHETKIDSDRFIQRLEIYGEK